MKQACYTKEDAIRGAVQEMENCCAYLTIGRKLRAAMCYGSACVYDEMLSDVFGVFLEEENEHYKAMLDIWYDAAREGA